MCDVSVTCMCGREYDVTVTCVCGRVCDVSVTSQCDVSVTLGYLNRTGPAWEPCRESHECSDVTERVNSVQH